MSTDIALPMYFASPVFGQLMEANQGKEHYGNAVRCSPPSPVPPDIDRVLDFNYRMSRKQFPQLSGHYQRWDDTVEVDGQTYVLHGWYEAV